MVKFGVLNVFDCMVVMLNKTIQHLNLDIEYGWKVSYIKHNVDIEFETLKESLIVYFEMKNKLFEVEIEYDDILDVSVESLFNTMLEYKNHP